MATIKRFEDIEAWKRARASAKQIGEPIIEGEFARDYKLRDQINGSSGSVMDNIAEGFERDGRKEFIQFLSFAKGSCGEVQSQLYRALDREYIWQEKFEQLYTEAHEIGKMIGGFMNYLKNTEHSGNKFREPIELYGSAKPEE
jgi:four helix bundle protein